MRICLLRELWAVLRNAKTMARKTITVLVLCLSVSSSALQTAGPYPEQELQFHALVPLGVEGFTLGSPDRKFYLMALAEHPSFEGLHQVHVDSRRVLLDAEGRQVTYFPRKLTFRITATTWADKLADIDSVALPAQPDSNAFLLGLRFRLMIFRGLKARTVAASSVKLIGMPADVSYNERIYRLSFDIGHVPVEDRIVLEVLSPTGDRLCKFHLELT